MKVLRKRRRWPYIIVVVIILGAYAAWTAERRAPAIKPELASTQLTIQSTTSHLSWPAAGESAVGLVGSSTVETNGDQKPTPTASTAKLITALSVLHVKPLSLGEQGPTLTLTAADAALYNTYIGEDGSVVPVAPGEQISEYQMLEAMLLPSANNMADSLAIWAFGSLPNYTAFAQTYVKQLGLDDTQIGTDASGFAPSTTSTAADLVRLGDLVMQNPVLTQIVSEPAASGIPVAGTVKNVNWLLGKANIIGIKTGNTNQAGGVYISASRVTVHGRPVTIVTALAGAPTLQQALSSSLPLIQSAQTNFQPITVITAGSIVGHYDMPWGNNLPVIASRQLAVPAWNGSSLAATVKLEPITTSARPGQTVGTLTVPPSSFAAQQSVPLTLATGPATPSFWWRLLHPFN